MPKWMHGESTTSALIFWIWRVSSVVHLTMGGRTLSSSWRMAPRFQHCISTMVAARHCWKNWKNSSTSAGEANFILHTLDSSSVQEKAVFLFPLPAVSLSLSLSLSLPYFLFLSSVFSLSFLPFLLLLFSFLSPCFIFFLSSFFCLLSFYPSFLSFFLSLLSSHTPFPFHISVI